jgi:TIR domain/Pentapeptide repeats (8 copies)
MANPEHLEILMQGVERWNKWREEHHEHPYLADAYLSGLDLSGVNLRGADLTTVNLREADLHGANLEVANLNGANLRQVNLRRANLLGVYLKYAELIEADLSAATLGGADLRSSNLRGANLREADFSWANLREADLRGADLGGADLNGAKTSKTIFDNLDLSSARGLETIVHEGPSTIGIDTIYKSRGKIPEIFLRGCGVPDEFIAYIGSMVGRPIEFYSCFISYSTKDQEFAERLHADLQAKGVRCWFAPDEMKGGRKLHEQIDEAIRLHDKLLLILSDDSMSSNWVKTEIANARAREKREGKQLLFPITLVPFEAIKQWKLFDADSGIDSAREIREYFIPDFSNWKDHDSYQKAFQRLVKDLKSGAGG